MFFSVVLKVCAEETEALMVLDKHDDASLFVSDPHETVANFPELAFWQSEIRRILDRLFLTTCNIKSIKQANLENQRLSSLIFNRTKTDRVFTEYTQSMMYLFFTQQVEIQMYDV